MLAGARRWSREGGDACAPTLRASKPHRILPVPHLSGLVAAVAVVGAFAWATPASAAVITVTTTQDDVTPSDGAVSLREAITAVNAGNDLGDPDISSQNPTLPGPFGSNDSIHFNVSLPGQQTILVGSSTSATGLPLPSLTKPMTLDATTQPGSSGTPPIGIVLDGTSAGGFLPAGLKARAMVTIKGFDIAKFSGYGIQLDDSPTSSAGSTIQGNFIGTNGTGTAASPNGGGILVGSSSNTIAGNVISGNGAGGAMVVDTDSNKVQGNLIGTNAAGSGAVPNGTTSFGVMPIAGAGNTIGGTTAAARNVISGNAGDAVSITGPGNTVEGNFIGTNAAGTGAIPNTGAGVALHGGGQTIAGTSAAPQRIWSNGGFGILDTANGDFFRRNSIARNGSGGISVPKGVPIGSVSLSANRRIVTIAFSKVTPGQDVTGEAFANPGAPGCPGQGERFLGSATQPGAAGSGKITIALSKPLAGPAGLTATLTDPQKGTSPFICLPAGIVDLHAAPVAFAAAPSGRSVTTKSSHKTGTKVSYAENHVAIATFAVRRATAGMKTQQGVCVKPPKGKAVKPSKRCTRYVAVGTFTHADRAGANKFFFTGRVRGKTLKAGSYRLDATPQSGGKNGKTVSVKFRIVP